MEQRIIGAKLMIVCLALAFTVPVLAHDDEITPAGHWNGLPHFISGPVLAPWPWTRKRLRRTNCAAAPSISTTAPSWIRPPRAASEPCTGPNVDNPVDLVEGKIAGREYLAYADDGSSHKNVALMVQVPKTAPAVKPLQPKLAPSQASIHGKGT